MDPIEPKVRYHHGVSLLGRNTKRMRAADPSSEIIQELVCEYVGLAVTVDIRDAA